MANVLSQSEIDELLNALSSGADTAVSAEDEEPKTKVREYNFRTANKFPKEQIRTLHLVFDNFARLLSTSMSGTLRTLCEAEVISVEEQTFGEYNNSLPSPVILAILNIHPMTGNTLMEISPEVAYGMISRLFGGTGDAGDSSKAFTEIELVIMERIIRKFTSIMVDSWEKIIRVQCTLDRIETSGQFAQIVSTNETIAIITINLKMGEDSGLINICIPHLSIEPISKQLNTKLMFSSANRVVESQEDMIAQRMMSTQVTMQAALSDTVASVRDILSLQVGDVIRINHNVRDPLTVKVEHIPKFRGVIGTFGNKYAVQVVDIVKEESEDE